MTRPPRSSSGSGTPPTAAPRGAGNQLDVERGWLGQTQDDAAGESGLTYLNARYYDPATARFTSPDPLLDAGAPRTLNPYTYALGNPTTYTDATGLIPLGSSDCGTYDHCNISQSAPATQPTHKHPNKSGHSSNGNGNGNGNGGGGTGSTSTSTSSCKGGICSVVTVNPDGSSSTTTCMGSICGASSNDGQGNICYSGGGRSDCVDLNAPPDCTGLVGCTLFASMFVPGIGEEGIAAKLGLKFMTALKAWKAERATGVAAETAGKIPWNSYADYAKVTQGGREYAQVGDRLYTQHAVDRMQPSGLGAPAGATDAGRSISPNFVEDVIQSGTPSQSVVDGVTRTIYSAGTVQVVTENGGQIVVKVLTK